MANTERLATTDANGNRVYVYTADVRGRFRSIKNWVHGILIFILITLPWLKISGHQALLLNIVDRRFTVFGVTFWAHDAPILVLLFIGGLFSLALVTALWGRLWCGWACPQTVFIDSVFRQIERWIEGDHLARRRLDQSKINFNVFSKKLTKWFLFSVVSLIVSHSFIAYFVGTDHLLQIIWHPPSENPVSFGAMVFISLAMLFDLGWFREQFCTLLCPYARFQSILMDKHSTIVAYDSKRADCINCFRCVQVCPTGIDIRQGTQLECVSCTSCIDVCNEVMTRLGRPIGLIRYDSEEGLAGRRRIRFLRPRPLLYAFVACIAFMGLAFALVTRQAIHSSFVRAIDTPYQEINAAGIETKIMNHFNLSVSNQSIKDLAITVQPKGVTEVTVITAQSPLVVKAGDRMRTDIFVTFPKRFLKNGKMLLTMETVEITRLAQPVPKVLSTQEVMLVGPFF
ncbi:MAG: cytochrome c oxidase accessory protein CcoG [Bdellovibrionota bacterium]